ncbi:MAG: hypothetical protein MUQ00_01250 [Candidatus Aminicenantes bacterium]|nr:hypothetical protein [Candidatus Aminicenantes bacterium]
MKDSEKNLAESIRHRLRNRFKESGEDIGFGLQRYASERFFYFTRQFSFKGEGLSRAIAATFKRRGTAIDAALPAAFTPRFFADDARAQQWRVYLTRNSLPGTPADFAAVGELLQAFLVPLWRALGDSRKFSDFWPPLGPWTVSKASEDPNL